MRLEVHCTMDIWTVPLLVAPKVRGFKDRIYCEATMDSCTNLLTGSGIIMATLSIGRVVTETDPTGITVNVYYVKPVLSQHAT